MLIAALVVLVGVAPLLLIGKFKPAGIIAAICWPLLSLLFWGVTPFTVWPLFGGYGMFVVILWVVSFGIGSIDDSGYDWKFETHWALIIPAALGIMAYIIVPFVTSQMLNADTYAQMIGSVEQRQWTEDVQPKDPRHVRLVPEELAFYLATKQLGASHNNVILGSQFQIEENEMTLQMVRGELWYVAPLEFKGLFTWNSNGTSPGYVMISAEDPRRPVIVKTDCKIVYTPGAFFGENLERHLWYSYYDKGLTDYSFEIDEEGKPWWVVSVFKPTIGWSGEKTLGVAIVNPETGDSKFYAVGDVPSWVDRVIPAKFVDNYVDWNGMLSGGWWNSWAGKKNTVKGLTPFLSYGADGNPYWVLDLTSDNEKDKSMVGLMYVNTRTGAVVKYSVQGGTSDAVVENVNNKVSYKKLHGSSPVLYNISGVMTAIVPLLGESHSYQGVAMVDVVNMQAVIGDDPLSAFRQYEHIITTGAQNLAPEKAYAQSTVTGVVERFVAEIRGGETYYYVYLSGTQRIFVGQSDVSPKLRLTKPGDTVTCSFTDSKEDTLQLLSFDDISVVVKSSPLQGELRDEVAKKMMSTRQ